MRNIQKLKLFRAKALIAFVSILFLALLSGFVASDTVHADPPDIVALQKYCKSHIKGNGDAGCTTKNINRIRDSVADDCKDNKNVQACVTNAGQDIIDQVAKQNPKNESDFNDALTGEIKAANDAKKAAKKKAVDDADACKGPGCPATPTGQGKNCDNTQCDLISLYVNPAIRLLSILVGLIVAGSLVMGGVQYVTSNGDPQKTGAAKTRITNTLLAFIVYAFMFAFFNFLVPGGLFN